MAIQGFCQRKDFVVRNRSQATCDLRQSTAGETKTKDLARKYPRPALMVLVPKDAAFDSRKSEMAVP